MPDDKLEEIKSLIGKRIIFRAMCGPIFEGRAIRTSPKGEYVFMAYTHDRTIQTDLNGIIGLIYDKANWFKIAGIEILDVLE